MDSTNTIYSGLIEGAAMTAQELYTRFNITPAEYDTTKESTFDFARRVIGSNPAQVENKGVSYSSGTSSRATAKKNTNNSNNYVMYSY